MIRYLCIVGLSLLLCGCTVAAHPIDSKEPPNLVRVRWNVWRSGQPMGEAEWNGLRAVFGSRRVTDIKLNFPDEVIGGEYATDGHAWAWGWDVRELGIPPRTNPEGLVQAVGDVLERPPEERMREIWKATAEIPYEDDGDRAWWIHCTNGHDRTGLAVGMVRLFVDHWPAERAHAEMLERGFHPVLIGLEREWDHQKEIAEP